MINVKERFLDVHADVSTEKGDQASEISLRREAVAGFLENIVHPTLSEICRGYVEAFPDAEEPILTPLWAEDVRRDKPYTVKLVIPSSDRTTGRRRDFEFTVTGGYSVGNLSITADSNDGLTFDLVEIPESDTGPEYVGNAFFACYKEFQRTKQGILK